MRIFWQKILWPELFELHFDFHFRRVYVEGIFIGSVIVSDRFLNLELFILNPLLFVFMIIKWKILIDVCLETLGFDVPVLLNLLLLYGFLGIGCHGQFPSPIFLDFNDVLRLPLAISGKWSLSTPGFFPVVVNDSELVLIHSVRWKKC